MLCNNLNGKRIWKRIGACLCGISESLHCTPETNTTLLITYSVQFSSVPQSGLTFCNPVDCSTPGFPVHHQLPELTQTHVHQGSDNIQPSHPLWSPSPAFNLSQYQGLYNESVHIRWPKDWSFSFNISPSNEYSDWFPLGWTGLISLQSKGLSRVFSNTTIQKHQFFSAQLSL